jgi:hypothetical protein
VLNASSSRNVPGGTEGYAYPSYPYAPSQQPQPEVEVGHPRSPPPPPPRNFPTQPANPNFNGNQVPRSLVAYQTRTGHDNQPLFPEARLVYPEAFPQEQAQEAFPPSFPVTHPRTPGPALAPDPANYDFPTPGRPGSHQPPVQSSGRYEFRSPGPQTRISLPRVYVCQTA